jgi:hypothetical protein
MPTAPGQDPPEEEIGKMLADVRARYRGDLSKITCEALSMRDATDPLTYIGRKVVGMAPSPSSDAST